VLRSSLKGVAIVAGAFLCFRYLGEFSVRQSAVLAVIAWIAYSLYQNAQAADEAKRYFVPHWVEVRPHWFELLHDYKLVPNDEISAEVYEKLSLGIRFFVLQRTVEEDHPGLIFWDNEKTFVTDISFSIPIPNTSCKEEYGLPELYFRERARPAEDGDPGIVQFRVPKESIAAERAIWKELGEEAPQNVCKEIVSLTQRLEIGLKVPTVWWKQMCASGELKELARTEAYDAENRGSTELVAATLPYWLFDGYYHKTKMNDLQQKLFRKRLELRENDLGQRGWKREESEAINSPTCLKHKYFTVWDNAI